MSASEDVKTLFRRFGGEPESYHEVIRDQQLVQSVGKWAMLGQVDLSHPQSIPAVHRVVQTATTRPSTEAAIPLAELIPARNFLPAATMSDGDLIGTASARSAQAPVAMAEQVTVETRSPPELPPAPPPSSPQRAAQAPAPALPLPDPVPTLSEPTAAGSPLASRLRSKLAPAAEPVGTEPEPTAHSLTSWFGRLAGPATTDAKVGVLRRKFHK